MSKKGMLVMSNETWMLRAWEHVFFGALCSSDELFILLLARSWSSDILLTSKLIEEHNTIGWLDRQISVFYKSAIHVPES
jgi:hypothetical protein